MKWCPGDKVGIQNHVKYLRWSVYEGEIVTRKNNFCKKFRVSNSKCNVIFCNSISQLDFVTQEFRTSFCIRKEYKSSQKKPNGEKENLSYHAELTP